MDHRGVKLTRVPGGLLGETVRRAWLAALIGIILTDVAAADIVRHGSIPKAYIGAWAPSANSCKPRSEAVVALSARRYVGAAMKCTVLGVYETPGDHGPIYSARMQCLGPATGDQRSTRNLIIVPEGPGQLSLGPDFNNLKSYQRCQSSKRTAVAVFDRSTRRRNCDERRDRLMLIWTHGAGEAWKLEV